MSSPEGSTVLFRRAAADARPRALTRFARKLQDEIAKGRSFDILITSDAEIRKLNHTYRKQDHSTDVLSFPSPNPQPLTPNPQQPLGSLAISLPRARAQAREFGHTTEQEIRVLMLHGLLHLLGMDHETDAGRMARAERRWRKRLGLPTALIERSDTPGPRSPAPGPWPPS
jgi:probable rRNA maturation factor